MLFIHVPVAAILARLQHEVHESTSRRTRDLYIGFKYLTSAPGFRPTCHRMWVFPNVMLHSSRPESNNRLDLKQWNQTSESKIPLKYSDSGPMRSSPFILVFWMLNIKKKKVRPARQTPLNLRKVIWKNSAPVWSEKLRHIWILGVNQIPHYTI